MNHQSLALGFVYFFVILVLIPAFCGDKVFSIYYHGDLEINQSIEKVKNDYRIGRVKTYLNEVNPTVSLLYHEAKLRSKSLDHLIVIVAKRTNDDFNVLSQLATDIDKGIRENNELQIGMVICNASRSSYFELNLMEDYYPIRQVKNTTTWKLFNPEEVFKHDFVECLSLGINTTSAKYITIISDRVVPYKNFLYTLNYVINTKLENYMYFGELYPKDEPWLFLHLQEPVVLRRFIWSWTCLYELFMITVIGSVVFFLIFKLMDPVGSYSTSSNRVIAALFGAMFFFTLALIIGRPYITELRRTAASLHRLYEAPEPVHFSGLNMPYSSAKLLIEHLSHIRCSIYVPFEEVLDQSINTLERPAYVISPSLLRFISPVQIDGSSL